MYKEDLALNNLQGLICHKNKSNQSKIVAIALSHDSSTKSLIGTFPSKLICFDLVSLFKGISTSVSYLMSKPSLKK